MKGTMDILEENIKGLKEEWGEITDPREEGRDA
jgi:hypothetical protein